jgi:uncharacterized protein YbjT (DUF2867 family)
MTRKTILAVGAAGQFAGLAVTALSELGARVRGFVRNAEQGNEAQRLGAAEVVIGDLRDLRSVDAALAGVDAVFYIAPAFLPDEAEVGKMCSPTPDQPRPGSGASTTATWQTSP